MNSIEHIRYNHLVHQRGELLHLFDLGQLKLIGGIAACLPLQDFSLLYPFSFADLHLVDHPQLAGQYSSLQQIEQCRVLDAAIELAKEGEAKAMVAVSYQNGMVCLLGMGKQEQTLIERSKEYLASPLLATMVDRTLEPDLYQTLQQATKALDLEQRETEQCTICTTSCSEEFFIEHVLSFPLHAEFTLSWGPTKDRYGRLLPTYLCEATVNSPR